MTVPTTAISGKDDLVFFEEPETKRAIRPARQWRNKWRALEKFRGRETGRIYQCGEVYLGVLVWPSKEVAEEKAAQGDARAIAKFGYSHHEHLGAEPVT